MPSLFPDPAPTEALFLSSNVLSDIAFEAAYQVPAKPNGSLVAVLFSAAWFEASLNEALEALAGRQHRESTSRLEQIRLAADAVGLRERHASVDRKLRVLCAAATSESLPDDRPPWSDVLLLFRLRNWIVHLRPERLKVRTGRDDEPSSLVSTDVHELVTGLVSAGAIASVPSGHMVPVTTALQLPGVATWAYRAAYGGLMAVDAWLPERYRPIAAAHRSPPLGA